MGQCGAVEKRGELWLRAGSCGDPGSVALTPVLSERHLLSRVISSRFFCEALRLSPGKTRVTRTPWGWATGFGLKGVGAGERFRVATGCVTTELGGRLVDFFCGCVLAFARCFIGQPALLAVWGIKVYCRHDQGAAKQARVVERTVGEGVWVVCQAVGFRSGPMTEG